MHPSILVVRPFSFDCPGALAGPPCQATGVWISPLLMYYSYLKVSLPATPAMTYLL